MPSNTPVARLPDPDGRPSRVFRRGGTVLRPAGPWTPARAAQLRHFPDGYELAAAERDGLVTKMIEYAIRDCAAEAVKAGITPDSADPAPLWALAWRSRSAAWMIRHRVLLENAITA